MDAIHPLLLQRELWPDVHFYKQQREIICSVRDNDETYVPAGNQLGKDYVSGYIALAEFLTHKEARVVTTSVKGDHLRVLWGEIGRFVQQSRIPLSFDKGGPLICNHWDIRKVVDGQRCPISYLRGMVCEHAEAMAGHHAPYTLGIIDEASGVDHAVYDQMRTWAKRLLIFGNCNPCKGGKSHFFQAGVTRGDIVAPDLDAA